MSIPEQNRTLVSAFGFSDADLTLNHQGRIAESQSKQIASSRRRRMTSLIVCAAAVLFLLAAACVPMQAASTNAPMPTVETKQATATLAATSTATGVAPTATRVPAATHGISAEAFAGIWDCCTGYEYHAVDGHFDFEHSLPAILNTELSGTMSIEGDVLTVIEDTKDCTPDLVGKYRVSVLDVDTLRYEMIVDPCTWRAKTGSAPMDGAVLHRTKPSVRGGDYSKSLSAAEAGQAGANLLDLAGTWELDLVPQAGGKNTYTLQHDGQVEESGTYLDADGQFVLNAPKLCAGRGEATGIFKVVIQGDHVNFYKTRADCAALIFVLRADPWIKK